AGGARRPATRALTLRVKEEKSVCSRRLASRSVALLAVVAAAAIASASSRAVTVKNLVVGDSDVAHTLDTQSTVPADRTTSANLYDRLVVLGTKANPVSRGGGLMVDPSHIVPSLASSWKVQKGGSEWLFTLRQGVKSSFGHELTADDVKWTFDRAIALRG